MRAVLDEEYKFPVEAKAVRFFLPLLKHVILEVLPVLLVGSALAMAGVSWSLWHCLCQTQGKLLAAFHRDSPVGTPLLHNWLKHKDWNILHMGSVKQRWTHLFSYCCRDVILCFLCLKVDFL